MSGEANLHGNEKTLVQCQDRRFLWGILTSAVLSSLPNGSLPSFTYGRASDALTFCVLLRIPRLRPPSLAALNTVLPDLDGRIRQITEALEAEVIPFPGSGMSLGDIDRRLAELEMQFQRLLEKAADDPIAYGDQFKEILDEQTALKELRASILAESKEHTEADRRIRDAAGMLENAVPHIAEWDESAVRQLVAQVKVLSKNEISVTLKSDIEIRQSISN